MAGLKMNVEFPMRLCEGHPAGQIGQVYGIVEFKDGVRRVDPVSIKFCDEENASLCALVKHNEALRKGETNAED